MRAAKLRRFYDSVDSSWENTTTLEGLTEAWKSNFDRRMEGEVEDLMADAGELNDGELPSHTLANLRESGFAENVDAYNEGQEFEEGLKHSAEVDGKHGGRKTPKS